MVRTRNPAVCSMVMPERNGYHQKDSSAWIAASSVRSWWTKGRSMRRSVVRVGMFMRSGGSDERETRGVRQRRVAPGASRGGIDVPRMEGTDGAVAGPSPHNLDPFLAGLGVADVGHERP